jgi:hypothetical protein
MVCRSIGLLAEHQAIAVEGLCLAGELGREVMVVAR